MTMTRYVGSGLLGLLLLGCGVELELDDGALVICASDAECPEPLTCQMSAHRCVDERMADRPRERHDLQ